MELLSSAFHDVAKKGDFPDHLRKHVIFLSLIFSVLLPLSIMTTEAAPQPVYI